MKVQVINKSQNALPAYETENSAGMDLRAWLGEGTTAEDFIVINPMERKLVHTGLYMALPKGWEAQIRPRSGLALKHGISIVNSPGTIDSDYRNEWGVILINLSDKPFKIMNGDRIAQVVFSKYEKAEFESVEVLDETDRKGGFGSTGTK